jgi:hypothetical protein
MAEVSGMEASSLFTTMYTCVAPQDAVSSPMRSTAAIEYPTEHLAGAMHDPGYGLRRIPHLRNPLNKPSPDVPELAGWHHVWRRPVGEHASWQVVKEKEGPCRRK